MFGRSKPTPETPANGNGNGNARGAAQAKPPAPQQVHNVEAEDGPADFEQLWAPEQAKVRKSVDALLLERGIINEEQLDQARKVAAQTPGKTLAQILLTMSAANEAQILAALAETLGMEFITPKREQVEQRAFDMLPVDYIKKHAVLPIKLENGKLVVAMTDPANVFQIDEIKRKAKRDIKVVVATAADMMRVVEIITNGSSDVNMDEIIKDMSEDDVQVVKENASEDVTDLEKAGSESPVIRFVNYLIFDALKQGASDIHIEPKEKQLKIRYRIDGILFEAMNPPHAMMAAIVSRLKIMANLDISERQLPQAGRTPSAVSATRWSTTARRSPVCW